METFYSIEHVWCIYRKSSYANDRLFGFLYGNEWANKHLFAINFDCNRIEIEKESEGERRNVLNSIWKQINGILKFLIYIYRMIYDDIQVALGVVIVVIVWRNREQRNRNSRENGKWKFIRDTRHTAHDKTNEEKKNRLRCEWWSSVPYIGLPM